MNEEPIIPLTEPAPAPQQQVAPPKSRKKLFAIVTIIMILVIAGISTYFVLASRKNATPPKKITTTAKPTPNVLTSLQNYHGSFLLSVVKYNGGEPALPFKHEFTALYPGEMNFTPLLTAGEYIQVSVSRNGKSISTFDWKTIKTASSDTYPVAKTIYQTKGDKEYIRNVLWSRDGSKLIFHTRTEIIPDEEYKASIYRSDRDGSNVQLITSFSEKYDINLTDYDGEHEVVYLYSYLDIRPSVDFTSFRSLSAIDGVLINRFTDENMVAGLFSADFSKLYYTNPTDGSLYEFTQATKENRKVYTPADFSIQEISQIGDPHVSPLAISPDGTTLFATEFHYEPSKYTDFLLSLNDGVVQRLPLTPSMQLMWASIFSPDGKLLCCYTGFENNQITYEHTYFYDMVTKAFRPTGFDLNQSMLHKKTEHVEPRLIWLNKE